MNVDDIKVEGRDMVKRGWTYDKDGGGQTEENIASPLVAISGISGMGEVEHIRVNGRWFTCVAAAEQRRLEDVWKVRKPS